MVSRTRRYLQRTCYGITDAPIHSFKWDWQASQRDPGNDFRPLARPQNPPCYLATGEQTLVCFYAGSEFMEQYNIGTHKGRTVYIRQQPPRILEAMSTAFGIRCSRCDHSNPVRLALWDWNASDTLRTHLASLLYQQLAHSRIRPWTS